MNDGEVSVIMPAYNGERFIEQAIVSVVHQSYPKWELIIIDDGSTDSTPEIIGTCNDPRIKYVWQRNRGQAAALNRGLELAQGEFITTLDVDDWYTPDTLAERSRFLLDHSDVGVVYGDGYYCDVDGNPLKRFSEIRPGDFTGDVYDNLITHPFFSTGGNVTVRKSVLDQYNLHYDESIFWCQDWDLLIRISEKTTFGMIDSISIWYRMHASNMTMTVSLKDKRIDSLVKTKLKVINSSRWASVPTAQKASFFHTLFWGHLWGKVAKQEIFTKSPQFQELPPKQQAKILRQIANRYLLTGQHDHVARSWLDRALTLTPYDPKTILTSMLANVNPRLGRLAVRYWLQINHKQESVVDGWSMFGSSD